MATTYCDDVFVEDREGSMSVRGAQQEITSSVTQWPNMSVAPHRFGGVEYLLGTREIGHIHGDSLVDIPFPSAIRNELVESGQVQPHHVLPESGWISFYIQQPEDIQKAIELLRRSYQIADAQSTRRTSRVKPTENPEEKVDQPDEQLF